MSPTVNNISHKQNITFGYKSPVKKYAKHCAYCSHEMYSDEEFVQYINNIKQMKGSQLEKTLQEASLTLEGVKKHIVIKLAQKSKQSPDKTFTELQESLESDFKNEQKEFKFYQFINIEILSLPNLPKKIKKYINKKSKHENIVLFSKIAKQLEKNSTPEYKLAHQKVLDVTAAEFFRINKNNSTYKLFEPLKSSIEHVETHTKSNKDTPENYIYTHKICNRKRGSEKFSIFVSKTRINPETIRESLAELKQNAAQDGYKDIQELMENVCKTLKSASKGQIDISV